MKYTKTFSDAYFVQSHTRPLGFGDRTYYEYYKFEDLPTLKYPPTMQAFEYVKVSRLKTSFVEGEVSIEHWVDKVLYRAPNEEYWRDLDTGNKLLMYKLIEDIRNHVAQKEMHKIAKESYAASQVN